MPDAMAITPETKVAALLEHYPELEETLIGMAPPFKKLRNPILRRSVARVASLRQAAAVGRLAVDDMVNTLRAAVGQEPTHDTAADAPAYFAPQPAWFDSARIVDSLDERDVDPDTMPLKPLLLRATKLGDAEILELVTAYLPAPGIDIMKAKGFDAWTVEKGDLISTYFTRSGTN